jgi:hypothetical protein
MKNLVHSLSVSILLAITSTVFAATGIPALDVTVSNAGGKLAFKGKTNASGAFATGTLEPGNYVVQFNSKDSAGMKQGQYLVVVSAGKKKVTADGVEGEKFVEGGVAMKVDVASGLKITGQVAKAGQPIASASGAKVKVMNGKRYVWIGPEIGSQMPGRWVEEGSSDAASALNRGRMSKEAVGNIQSKNAPTLGGPGS